MRDEQTKLTKAQREVLHILSLRPNGAWLREMDTIRALLSITHHIPALVSDVYSMPAGGMMARITEAGRAAILPRERKM